MSLRALEITLVCAKRSSFIAQKMTFPVKDFLSKKKFSVSREIALTYIEVLLRLCSDFNKNVKKPKKKL